MIILDKKDMVNRYYNFFCPLHVSNNPPNISMTARTWTICLTHGGTASPIRSELLFNSNPAASSIEIDLGRPSPAIPAILSCISLIFSFTRARALIHPTRIAPITNTPTNPKWNFHYFDEHLNSNMEYTIINHHFRETPPYVERKA